MTSQAALPYADLLATAIRHHQEGQLQAAAAMYRDMLAADADNFDALHLLGVIALQEGSSDQAIELISAALDRQPDFPAALGNLGRAYTSTQQLQLARECFERAVALEPGDGIMREILAVAYQRQGENTLALAEFRAVVALMPESPEANSNLGGALAECGMYDEAISRYMHALALKPNFWQAQLNLARTLELVGRTSEALALYQEVLVENPRAEQAHFCLGVLLQMQGMIDDAVDCFNAALDINPEYAEVRWALAMVTLAIVFGVGDDPTAIRGDFVQALKDLDAWFTGTRVDEGYRAVGTQGPFFIAYYEEKNRELLTRYGDLCVRLMKAWRDKQAFELRKREPEARVHLGIVSAHIRDHSVWIALLKGVCKQIDRSRIAIHLFYTGRAQDRETEEAKGFAEVFVQDSKGLGPFAAEIAAHQLDAIIYPEISMDAMTSKLASMRLAPIQMTMWGHPETSGLSTIDYYISADGFEPEDAQANYSEKLVTLPNLGCCYQALDVPVQEFDPVLYGIDPTAPLLVCPGTPFKYSPGRDWIFVEIARRLGRCQFLFFHYGQENLSDKLRERLAVAFDEAGMYIDEYVVFVPWLSRPQFYALLRRADVFLDTIGFSGFNTAMQAVECALPIVTMAGRFMRGRLAAGILDRIELSDYVAKSEQEYVELAVQLAQRPELREGVKAHMVQARAVLFDDLAPARALEEFIISVCKTASPHVGG